MPDTAHPKHSLPMSLAPGPTVLPGFDVISGYRHVNDDSLTFAFLSLT